MTNNEPLLHELQTLKTRLAMLEARVAFLEAPRGLGGIGLTRQFQPQPAYQPQPIHQWKQDMQYRPPFVVTCGVNSE